MCEAITIKLVTSKYDISLTVKAIAAVNTFPCKVKPTKDKTETNIGVDAHMIDIMTEIKRSDPMIK